MSDDLVKRAREALDGVTEGPWWAPRKYDGSKMGCAILAARTDGGPILGSPARAIVGWASVDLKSSVEKCEANARFIVASRELVPAMADRIEELEAKLAVAVAALSYYANHEILFLYDDASFARDTIAELTGGQNND